MNSKKIMPDVSQHTQRVLDSSFGAFVKGDIDTAISLLDAATSEGDLMMNLHDSFSVGCMRASLAAMCGERTVAQYMADAAASHLHRPAVLYLEGVTAMAGGTNFQTASVKFEEAIRIDPHFILARLGLAAVCFYMGRYKNSFSHYRAVLETFGSSAPSIVRVGMGLCSYHLGRLEYAVKWLDRALEVDPNDATALLALLVISLNQRRMLKVVEVVQRLRTVLPDNAVVLLKVADLLYFRAVSEKRVKALSRTILRLLTSVRHVASAEESAIADYQEGRLLVALGELANARTLLESSMQVLPNLLAARIHYARLLLLSGRDMEAEQLLLRINAEHPNQKEVLQMLAAQASRLGLLGRALECSKLLTDSIAPGDIRSWSLAAWCARLNGDESKKLLGNLVRIHKEVGEPVTMNMLVNVASVNRDVEALQRILDSELGADFLSTPKLSVAHVPLVYNLALLLEKDDPERSRKLYIFLVKQHGHFRLPYIRLHVLARAAGRLREAVSWMVLVQQILPDEPHSIVSIAELYFRQKRFAVAMFILRSAEGRSLPVALALGSIYLWCGQQRDKDSRRFVEVARDRFAYVLRKDKGNVLAAHGLACCFGLVGEYDNCQSLLDRVGEVLPNCDYVRQNHEAHMANAKILSDCFKQAIDYLERDTRRTPLQSSSLAFCLSCEGRYDDAIAVQKTAVAAAEEQPLLKYNLALLYCASFISAIARKQALTIDEARELRKALADGLTVAREFMGTESQSRVILEAKMFLRQACMFCLHHNENSIQQLVASGHRTMLESERLSSLWRQVYAEYLDEKQSLEEQHLAEEQQRKELEQQVAQGILEDYRETQGRWLYGTMAEGGRFGDPSSAGVETGGPLGWGGDRPEAAESHAMGILSGMNLEGDG